MQDADRKILYVDMDDVLCNFSKRHRERLELEPEIAYPQSQYGFFRNLEPMPGALAAMQRLRASDLFQVWILTAPSIPNPLCYLEKRDWVEEHLGVEMLERLIISPNKGLCKGDFLIDDYERGKGQENFEGRLLVFGREPFTDWAAVLTYFEREHGL